jgi:hypothetical protein
LHLPSSTCSRCIWYTLEGSDSVRGHIEILEVSEQDGLSGQKCMFAHDKQITLILCDSENVS